MTILIEYIRKAAPKHFKSAKAKAQSLQDKIKQTEKETSDTEQSNIKGLDELEGSATNNLNHIYR